MSIQALTEAVAVLDMPDATREILEALLPHASIRRDVLRWNAAGYSRADMAKRLAVSHGVSSVTGYRHIARIIGAADNLKGSIHE